MQTIQSTWAMLKITWTFDHDCLVSKRLKPGQSLCSVRSGLGWWLGDFRSQGQRGVGFPPGQKKSRADRRYMLKYVAGYVPPDGWKPQRLVKKRLGRVGRRDAVDGGNPSARNDTRGKHCLLLFLGLFVVVFWGIESFQGFLGGAGIRPSTLWLVFLFLRNRTPQNMALRPQRGTLTHMTPVFFFGFKHDLFKAHLR